MIFFTFLIALSSSTEDELVKTSSSIQRIIPVKYIEHKVDRQNGTLVVGNLSNISDSEGSAADSPSSDVKEIYYEKQKDLVQYFVKQIKW